MTSYDQAFYDQAFYDSGVRYADAAGSQPKTKMIKVKLDLQSRDDEGLLSYAKGHRDAMAGNAHFPTPDPTPAVFDAALDNYEGALADVTVKQDALKTAVRLKNELRAVLEDKISLRGDHVAKVADGVESVAASAGMSFRAAATPTSDLPQVQNVRATAGDNSGEVDVAWDGDIKGKRGFAVQSREHLDGTVWSAPKFVTASRTTMEDLTPGKTYAFRVQVLGPKELVGPWSDEAVKMSP